MTSMRTTTITGGRNVLASLPAIATGSKRRRALAEKAMTVSRLGRRWKRLHRGSSMAWMDIVREKLLGHVERLAARRRRAPAVRPMP